MPKGYDRETRFFYDLPTPRQLFDLTSHGVVLANEQKKLRASRIKKGAHFFMPSEVSTMMVDDKDDDCREIRQKIAGRIGKAGYRLWTMRMIDSFWAEQTDGNWFGVRSTYKFEWTDQKTLLAERLVRQVPAPDPVELVDEIDQFFVADDISDIWDAEIQLRQVTSGDVELLTQNVADFSSLSRNLAR